VGGIGSGCTETEKGLPVGEGRCERGETLLYLQEQNRIGGIWWPGLASSLIPVLVS
jgi:hypothetical protein